MFMSKFKVGDWVRIYDMEETTVHELDEDKLYLVNQLYISSVEHWQPQEGEWCLFWYTNCSPTLAQYVDFAGDSAEDGFIASVFTSNRKNIRIQRTEYYPNCAPFIGSLPNFMKDK